MGWSSENPSYKINKLSWLVFLEKKSAKCPCVILSVLDPHWFNPDPELDPDPDPDPGFR